MGYGSEAEPKASSRGHSIVWRERRYSQIRSVLTEGCGPQLPVSESSATHPGRAIPIVIILWNCISLGSAMGRAAAGALK
jgi:hypothetical protein